MDCSEVRFEYESRSECVKFVFVGDVHIGHANTDEDLARMVAQRLEEPGVFWFDLGDRCDFINTSDRRFDVSRLPDWIGTADLADLAAVQMEKYAGIFGGVGRKCIMALYGNHEVSIRRRYERNVYRELNAKLGLYDKPHGFTVKGTRTPGVGGFVRMRFKRKQGDVWTLRFFMHHGAGGGKLAGAKALNLERLPMAFDADVYAMGHTHTKIGLSKRRVGMLARQLRVKDKPLVLINTGAFMRSYAQSTVDGYVEERLLYPQGLGPVELWVWPDKQQVRVVQ